MFFKKARYTSQVMRVVENILRRQGMSPLFSDYNMMIRLMINKGIKLGWDAGADAEFVGISIAKVVLETGDK